MAHFSPEPGMSSPLSRQRMRVQRDGNFLRVVAPLCTPMISFFNPQKGKERNQQTALLGTANGIWSRKREYLVNVMHSSSCRSITGWDDTFFFCSWFGLGGKSTRILAGQPGWHVRWEEFENGFFLTCMQLGFCSHGGFSSSLPYKIKISEPVVFKF